MTAQFDRQVSKPISRLAKSGALGGEQVRAAMAIEDAVVSILTNGIRSGFIEERRGGGMHNTFESGFLESCALRQAYNAWVVAMKQAGLPAGPVLDVIIDGTPLTIIDKRRCKRKGWTRDRIKKALDLYISAQALEAADANRLTA